jgi:hypothetical protein
MVASKSFASLRFRPIHAKNRSTTQRRGPDGRGLVLEPHPASIQDRDGGGAASVSSAHLLASEQDSFCRVNLELLRFDIGPDVWSGRASQEVFVDLSDVGLASMYPASHWSVS